MNYAILFINGLKIILALFIVLPILSAIIRSASEAAEKRRAEESARIQEAQRQEAARKAAEHRAQEAARRAAEAAEAKEKARRIAESRKAERARAAEAKQAEKARIQAEKLEAARQLAEYKERALQAEKELRALRTETISSRPPVEACASTPAKPASADAKPGAFSGEEVAFTGTCPKMNRNFMIAHVVRLGGKGYETINTRCTLLVVGEKPGKTQLDKAEKWNIPTITWGEWWDRAFDTPAYIQQAEARKAA